MRHFLISALMGAMISLVGVTCAASPRADMPQECPKVVFVELATNHSGARCALVHLSSGTIQAWCVAEVGA
jgi:hypothetical protein